MPISRVLKPAAVGGVCIALGAFAGASGAFAAASPHAAVASKPPKVSVKVVGANKVLLPARKVQTKHGWVVKGGHGRGKCPATSAQGALNVATHGHWGGQWSTEYGPEWLITNIMGVKPNPKNHYWEILLNGKAASKGACELKLHSGDRLVFKDVKF